LLHGFTGLLGAFPMSAGRYVEESARLAYIAGFTALAVVLRFFEVPFPPAPFLKYDFSGVPLAVLGFKSLKWAYASLPLYYIASVIAGADPIGMAMKALAEASTFTPLVLAFRRLAGRLSWGSSYALSALIATASRTIVMTLANLAVTPFWLMMAYPKYYPTYDAAYGFVVNYAPWIALFNASLSAIILATTAPVYKVLARTGVIHE